jgi:hypothetical protein
MLGCRLSSTGSGQGEGTGRYEQANELVQQLLEYFYLQAVLVLRQFVVLRFSVTTVFKMEGKKYIETEN